MEMACPYSAVLETSAGGVALMPRDGWVAQRGRLSGAMVLAIGLVPQFVSMWHILGLECSSWLLYLYVGSLGRDGRTAGD